MASHSRDRRTLNSCKIWTQELSAGGDVKPLGKDADARAAALMARKSTATHSWQDALQLAAAKAMPAAKSKAKSQPRMTNYKFLLGFNHQFEQGTGHGLASWMLEQPLCRLPPSTVRVLVDCMCPLTSSIRPRCFLKHEPSDVISDTPELIVFNSPAVHTCCDVGTVGNVGLNYLYYGAPKLCGTLTFDILHRFMCAWTDGIGAGGLHVQRLEMGVYVKFRSAPFNKDGCHEQMIACAKDLQELFPSHDDLPWMLFYSRCAREKNKYSDADFGMPAHSQALYNEVAKETTQETGAGTVRRGRWWNIEERAEVKLPLRGGDSMVLTHMGMRKGWWKSFSSSPLLLEDVTPVAIGEPPADDEEDEPAAEGEEVPEGDDPEDGPGVPGASAANARKTMQERRADSDGTLHYMARLLGKPINMKLWTGIAELAKPFRKAFAKIQVALSTPRGTRDMWDSLVMDSFIGQVIGNALKSFTSLEFASKLGIATADGSSTSAFDSKIISSLWTCLVGTCGSLACMHGHYQQIPAKFLGLLREQHSELREWLRQLWNAMNVMEQYAHVDLRAAKYLTEMGVTDLHWCKANLVNLYEHDFQEVSPLLKEAVRAYADSFHSTLALERGFNFCREAAKQNKKGSFNAESVWHHFVYGCDVLADHGRPALKPSEKARSASTSVNARTFKPLEEESSFPKDKLDPLTQPGQGGCRTTSTSSLKSSPMMLLAMVELKGSWPDLQKTFVSLLVYPMDVLINKVNKCPHLVLASTAYGCWLYKCNVKKYNGNLYLSFTYDPKTCLRFVAIVDHNDWRACEVQACPPTDKEAVGPEAPPLLILLLALKAHPLVIHGARHGFRGIVVEFLKRLYKLLQVNPGEKMPLVEAQLVTTIIRFVLKGVSDEDLAKHLQCRRDCKEFVWDDHTASLLFEKGAEEWVAETVEDENLQEEVREARERAAAARRAAVANTAKIAADLKSGAASGSGAGAAAGGAQNVTCNAVKISMKWARGLMPPEHLLTWEPESNSWRVRSPKHMAVGRSRAAGPATGDSQWGALKFVLLIAWNSWRNASGNACPYVFD